MSFPQAATCSKSIADITETSLIWRWSCAVVEVELTSDEADRSFQGGSQKADDLRPLLPSWLDSQYIFAVYRQLARSGSISMCEI